MQVGCGKCGATYQFDASAIPAEGYNARCTNCGEIFFVKAEVASVTPAPASVAPAPVAPAPQAELAALVPPAPEQQSPASAAPPDQISVSCKQCNAVYLFAPADIPAEGYDARCTQCQSIFFVSRAGDVAAPSIPTAPPVTVSMPQVAAGKVTEAPVELTQPKSQEPAPVELSQPKVTTAARVLDSKSVLVSADSGVDAVTEEPLVPAIDNELVGAQDRAVHDDLIALATELGEPAEAPAGASMELDFEQIMARKRKRLMIVGAVIVAIPTLTVLTYLVLPGVFDVTIGPLIGVKARIHPDAVPLKEAAYARMLADTTEGYDEAIEKLSAALEIDDRYPEAMALAALAHVFRGKDIRERGQAIHTEAEKVVVEIKTIQEAKKRSKNSENTVAALRVKAMNLGKKSSKLYEESGDEFSKADKLLRRGLKEFKSSPTVLSASGIYLMGRDPDRINAARERLAFSLNLLGVDEKLDLESPPDLWTPFLQGNLDAESPKTRDASVDAFKSAVAKEPRFQRARYEMLLVLDEAGKRDQAREVAAAIVKAVPNHKKAKGYLARPVVGDAGEDPAPAPAPAPPAKGKKRKKKRH